MQSEFLFNASTSAALLKILFKSLFKCVDSMEKMNYFTLDLTANVN